MDWINSEPHWILVTIIGAFVALIIERLPSSYRSVTSRKGKEYIFGNWKMYHWSYKNNLPVIIESTCEIKKSLMKGIKVICHQDTGLEYEGNMIPEGDDRIIFTMKSKNEQSELWVLRFIKPLSSRSEEIFGIWLSFDHDKHICSGAVILSKQKLISEDIEVKLKQYIQRCQKAPIMRLNEI